jgi:hypothetical protein
MASGKDEQSMKDRDKRRCIETVARWREIA